MWKLFLNGSGEGGDAGLQGWLTSKPKLVEEWLPIEKNTVTERADEIERQKTQFLKKRAAAIKKLTTSWNNFR